MKMISTAEGRARMRLIRKARAKLPPETLLGAELRDWRQANGLNTEAAGEALGIPARTVEYIEAGRGFRYPLMLRLTMKAWGQT